MTTLFISIGIIALIASGILFFLTQINKQNAAYNAELAKTAEEGTDKYWRKSKNIIELPFNWMAAGIIGLLLIMFGAFNPFSINDAGNRQVVQTLGGDLWVKFNPGFYFSGFGSKVTTYPNNITIQISNPENKSPNADFWFPENDGTFSEGDNADLSHTVKWDLPNDEPTMLELHTTYNSIENLATTTLAQFQKQTASYSCQRMSSEEHYSGGESQLNQYFQDQLRHGQVLLITETKTQKQTDGSTKTYIEVSPKLAADGTFLRNKESIQDIKNIGMNPSFASVDGVKYDPEIYIKLKKKIEYAAEEANSKQELVAEQQKAETAKVRGEKLIAEKRAKEEADKIEAVIRAEKEAEVAIQNVRRDEAKAKSTLALKRAEAEGDRLKVLAGLSPKEQAQFDKETAIGVAEALAGPNGLQLPGLMVTGGQGNGQVVNPFDAIGLEAFINISKQMANRK